MALNQLVSGEILAPGTELKVPDVHRSSDKLCSLLASSVLQRSAVYTVMSSNNQFWNADDELSGNTGGIAVSTECPQELISNSSHDASPYRSALAAPHKPSTFNIHALLSQKSEPASRLRRNLETAKAADAATETWSRTFAAPRRCVRSDLADLPTSGAAILAPVQGGRRRCHRGDLLQTPHAVLDADSYPRSGAARPPPSLDARYTVSTLGSRSFEDVVDIEADVSPLVSPIRSPRRLSPIVDQPGSASHHGCGAASLTDSLAAAMASPERRRADSLSAVAAPSQSQLPARRSPSRAGGPLAMPPLGAASAAHAASERLTGTRTSPSPPPRPTARPAPNPPSVTAMAAQHGVAAPAASASPPASQTRSSGWARRAADAASAFRTALASAGRRHAARDARN